MPIKKNRLVKTGIPGIVRDGPDERFLVTRWFVDPHTGKRRKREKVVEGSLAEAVEVRAQLLGAAPTVRLTRLRFGALAERWLEENASRLAPSTKQRYKTTLAHASVAFGQVYVDAILASDIRSWQLRMVKHYAPASVNGYLRVLRVLFDDPLADGIIPRNPARLVRSLPEGRTKGKRGTSLSLDEFRRVLEAIPELVRAEKISAVTGRMIITLAWTGMRRGELLELRWSDMVEGELRVERSVYRRVARPTKTDDPRRVTISAPLEQVLQEQRSFLLRSQHPGLSSGLIYPATPKNALAGATRRGVDELSWYHSPSALDAPLRKVVTAAEVPPISCQSFRRTFENLQRRAGVDQLVRRAVSGWRTETAQGIYATVAREERDQAAVSVVDLVMGKRG